MLPPGKALISSSPISPSTAADATMAACLSPSPAHRLMAMNSLLLRPKMGREPHWSRASLMTLRSPRKIAHRFWWVTVCRHLAIWRSWDALPINRKVAALSALPDRLARQAARRCWHIFCDAWADATRTGPVSIIMLACR